MDIFTGLAKKIPVFQQITKLRIKWHNNEMWLCCIDVFREMGNSSSRQHVLSLCKGYELNLHNQQVTHEWNSIDKRWEAVNPSGSEVGMIHHLDLKPCLLRLSKRSRKTKIEKISLLTKFNITLTDVELRQLRVPIECSVLELFISACPFSLETQYRLGRYKLDAYIPRLKIAIEIDEDGHKSYQPEEEKNYDMYLRDLGIVCIRFIPDENNPVVSATQLINRVWSRTISPDFGAFSQKYALG